MALIQLYILIGLGLGTAMEGFAPRYDPGVMEVVMRNRDLQPVPCMVSSPYYDIGEWVWIWGVNTKVLRHCRITDVSDTTVRCRKGHCESDMARHKRLRRIAELSYEAALSLCGKAHMADAPTNCPIIVFRLEEQ